MARSANPLKLSRQLLYEQLADRLRELIEKEKLWGKGLPGERQLARTFGVSQETVRKGLGMLVRAGLIVRKQGQGTRVLPRRSRNKTPAARRVMLGGFWASGALGYAGRIMIGLGTLLGEAGNSLNVSNLSGPDGRDGFLAAVDESSPDGVILLGVSERTLVEEILKIRNTPLVVVDHHFPGLPITSVRDDSRGGARQAVEHLLGLGHTRIGYLDMTRGELNPWRYEGYVEALCAAGIEADPELHVSCLNSVAAGREAAEKLLELPHSPTALVTFDNKRAMGACRAAEARGLVSGSDFAVVGFDGEGNPPGEPGELTSVHVDAHEIGRIAVRELNSIMDGEVSGSREVLVPTTLVVGASSGGLREGG